MRGEAILPFEKPWIMFDQLLTTDLQSLPETISIKNISSSDMFLIGHFPSYSIFPGMLLVEGMKQSAQMWLSQGDGTQAQKWIEKKIKARFLLPVGPGDQVHYVFKKKIEDHDDDEQVITIHAEGWVKESKVIQVTLSLCQEGGG
ncbi:hypothetical protein [Longirhabdus pacifica]|uniref:hypothetical protein n=1 Tax=Longirhabdus pacifica TaxID=2305227 RepID=UPI001008E85F|nr:hypothetical protein [Longirhabdus pacifica]